MTNNQSILNPSWPINGERDVSLIEMSIANLNARIKMYEAVNSLKKHLKKEKLKLLQIKAQYPEYFI